MLSIVEAPVSGRVAAFFDVDDTLINIKTMFSFLDYLKSDKEFVNNCDFVHYELELNKLIAIRSSREEINKFYYKAFKGLDVSDLRRKVDHWYDEIISKINIFNDSVVKYLKWHQSLGHEVVLVSGSCEALLAPIVKQLKVTKMLVAMLEVKNHKYTGELIGPPSIGMGKAARVKKFAVDHKISLQSSYAYGDDVSDAPMLMSVGNARLVNPTPQMIEVLSKSDTFNRNQIIKT
ncbi:HAD family hydrolase [Marinagarivorans cellulosilyticus]|uniref:HAD-IB family hydrolase n=1 Tax=Marinagarivorans cellulosilyticus TaxID=2721545 RepID=A0AAN2BJ15_9GAMM|nr:HAD-IB family hydrolase [Marinagarivorans cellulosilyticus]BCD96469.1 hypothetical protein MARGE09_P0669 [Marinagarivorans cellulosilyticus]